MEHYLFLNSVDSEKQHPDNTFADFTVELPRTYLLDGVWECYLREVETDVKEDFFYVCTNICQESYVENTLFPVLRAVTKSKSTTKYYSFDDPFYFKLTVDTVNRVRIFIRGRGLRPISSSGSVLRCTLHIRKWT